MSHDPVKLFGEKDLETAVYQKVADPVPLMQKAGPVGLRS